MTKTNYPAIIKVAMSFLVAFGLAACSDRPDDNVAVITSPYAGQAETEAMVELLSANGSEVSVFSLSDLKTEDLDGFKTVIYHRPDTSAIDAEELASKEILLPFVQKGGNLMLTMDAVRLLNEWGVEPQPIEVKYESGVDHGFGRPLGFHGYREHPMYEGLFGGAYTWKADFDHQARTLGFHGSNLPQAEGARVLGISWIYIYYLENSKILWETPVGDGKILAVGGHLYFSRKNLNRTTLEIFMDNTIDWLNGTRKFNSKENYWSFDDVAVAQTQCPDFRIRVKTENSWTPEVSSIAGVREGRKSNFWSVTGQQVAVFGHEAGNIEEVWFHPIMGLRDMSFGVRYRGSEDVVWVDTQATVMVRSPYNFERIFTLANGGTVTENINAAPEEPLFTINYSWNDPDIEEIFVAYTSNLRLMWPYSLESTGTLYYANDGAVTTVFDRAGKLNMITAFDIAPAEVKSGMYDFRSRDVKTFGETPAKHKSVTFLYRFPAESGKMNFYMSGGECGLKQSAGLIRKYMGNTKEVYAQSKAYYDGFDKEFLAIETDDSVFNMAYRWALVSVDKFYTHTPSLGKSLTSGMWSTSRGWGGGHAVSGRPGYVWYFGRDTEFTALSMVDYGDYEKVREIIKTFGKYQDPDGKVYHELTTSGSAHYDASDATPLYIVLAGYYLEKTGDTEFIRSQWSDIKKALSFCYSTDTDGDGLIENTNVGHGWQEGWQLHGAHTEVYLAAIWKKALQYCEVMGNLFGDEELAAKCAQDALVCQDRLDNGFWNEEMGFYNHGLMIDGSYQEHECVLGHAPVFFGHADKDKAVKTALTFSNKFFSTDWGVRMVGYDSPFFGLGGYTYGNIWPFHNGCAATAEYRAGLRYQGFRHAYSNLRLFDTWDFGNIAEVILGNKLEFTGIAAHQQWSSGMNLYPLYQGMLGIDADALKDEISLSPAFPTDLSVAKVRNIRLGEKKIDMDYKRTDKAYVYSLSSDSSADMIFTAVLPLATVVESVEVDGAAVEFSVYDDVQNVCVSIAPFLLQGAKTIAVKYNGGIGAMLNLQPLVMGRDDDGIRIERESYDSQSRTYTLEVAGAKGRLYELDVLALSDVVSVSGAELVEKKGDITTLRISFPEKSNEPFVDGMITIQL